MAAAARILVIEDDRNLAETLVYNLRQEGYLPDVARTGPQAIIMARNQHPDLLLLDVMLPEMDGFDVCRAVRASSPVPIIMLTALDDEVDKVLGLELGADDFIVKPFSLRELLARIRATLRRVELSSPGEPDLRLTFAEIQIEPDSRSVRAHRTAVHLLPKEFDLLLYLARNHGIIFSRQQLLEKVWGTDYYGDPRTVDVHIRRLRMKIERDAAAPELIRTIYGVGYTFDNGPRQSNDA